VADGVREHDKEKFQILSQQFQLGVKRALLYEKVQELSITDPLTHALTHRYWLERFKEEIERSKKFKYQLSCLIVDIDHFKDYNDHYGHLVGDAILSDVSHIIKENIRQIDTVGKYGGDELAIVLAETDKEGAKFAAERMRRSIEGKHIRVYDEDLKVTVSIGVSVFPDDGQDMKLLFDRADNALYCAKERGRNRISAWGDS
jgi:diguanylate cyclase (GGDEF)-like protein